MNEMYPALGGGPGSHADLMKEALTRLCGTLGESDLSALITRTELIRIRVGETLYRQGESGDCLHVVLTGRLQVRVADK